MLVCLRPLLIRSLALIIFTETWSVYSAYIVPIRFSYSWYETTTFRAASCALKEYTVDPWQPDDGAHVLDHAMEGLDETIVVVLYLP